VRPHRENIVPWKFFLAFTPFALGASFFWLWIARDAAMVIRARQWVARPATILDVEMAHGRSRRGGSTSKVVAHYQYEFEGATYVSDRVAIYSGRDNLGSFQRDMYHKLAEVKRQGGSIPCYVNPTSPSEALLFREPRPAVLGLQLLFAGACSFVCVHLLRTCRIVWRGDAERESPSSSPKRTGDGDHHGA
jgi:hypothetical protein